MKQLPDKNGYFGELGGCFVAETLYNAHVEIEKAYRAFRKSSEMKRELNELLNIMPGARPRCISRNGFRPGAASKPT